MFLALESGYPADHTIGVRTAAMYRSLGTVDGKAIDQRDPWRKKLSQADPRDHVAPDGDRRD